jgi:hypothetical protein
MAICACPLEFMEVVCTFFELLLPVHVVGQDMVECRVLMYMVVILMLVKFFIFRIYSNGHCLSDYLGIIAAACLITLA